MLIHLSGADATGVSAGLAAHDLRPIHTFDTLYIVGDIMFTVDLWKCI